MNDPETISQNEESTYDSRESICRSRTGTIKKKELSIEEAKELAAKRRKKIRNRIGYITVFLLVAAGILVPIIVSATRKPPVYRVTHPITSKPITTTGQTRTTTTVITTTITPIDTCERHFVALSKNLDAFVISLVIADLNGDNKNDIVFICESKYYVSIIFNLGNNKFVDPIQHSTPNDISAVIVADIDDDNDLDIIVGLKFNSNYSVQILFNNGIGSFDQTIGLIASVIQPLSSIVVADINDDGKSDIIISIPDENIIGIYLNKGDRIFDDMTTYPMDKFPMSVYATDLNNDNKPDIIVANAKSNSISILFNQGDGTFPDPINYIVGTGPIFVTAADLNHDNQSDIILVNYFSNNIVIYLNNGSNNFTYYTNFSAQANPLSVALNDYNSDGSIDIIVPNYHSNNIQVFFNDGTGIFSQSTTYNTYPQPRPVAAADMNNDNKPDIVFGNGNYVATILTRCDL